MTARLHIQDFETGVVGVPVGRLTVDADDDARALAQLTADWRADGVWLVSCRLPPGSAAIPVLEEHGFRAVETLVTFRRALAPAPTPKGVEPKGVEPARPGDADACVAIAGRAFTHDRLHRDKRVPAAAADLIRERWVRNDLGGRADASLVARDGGAVVGFNLCLRDGDEAVIDLIAVDAGRRNKGIGRRLVDAAIAHYAGRARAMRVGTQADNAPSIKLYRAAGFVEADRKITLHWLNPDAAPTLTETPR